MATPRGTTTTNSTRYAPPRASNNNNNNNRLDPFADFTSGNNGFNHQTILSSLASERAEAAEKRELAKHAGNLLRRLDSSTNRLTNQSSSVGRASSVSSSAVSHNTPGRNSQPASQLMRLQMSLKNLRGGGGENENVDDEDSHYHDENSIHLLKKAGSPSRTDFNSFMNQQQNPNDVSQQQQQQYYNHESTTGGKSPAVGLSNSTAQNILRDMHGLKDSISRLESHLMQDMKRRVEAHAALQRTVELRVREIAENAEKKGQDRTVKLHHTLDALTQRVSKLEDALAVEREKNARLVQELKYHSARGLQDIRQQLETERNARSERIASASRNFSQELFRVEEHIAVAKRAREGLSEEVRDAIVKAQEVRAESEDKLLQSLMNDVKILRSKLEKETIERETGEEQLAGAMADLAQHLQSL